MRGALAVILGVVFAVVLHAGVLLFGGLLIPKAKDGHVIKDVELIGDDVTDEPEKPEPLPEEKKEDIVDEEELPPDASKMLQALDTPVMDTTPQLDAMSLDQIESLLSGQTGSGDFAGAVSLQSGRLGGSGTGTPLEQAMEAAFDPGDIDQKPRPVFQAGGVYPAEMRGKKLEGLVTVIFIVDPSGKVTNPKVEKSNHKAFERPALDAIKKWKFEPGVRGGQRVACKMRVPVRFQPPA